MGILSYLCTNRHYIFFPLIGLFNNTVLITKIIKFQEIEYDYKVWLGKDVMEAIVANFEALSQ